MRTPGFIGRLALDFGEWDEAGRIAITLAPILWHDGKGFAVTIPAETMTDGASVPRLGWWFMPPFGDRSTLAAILHDYLLDRLQGFVPGGAILAKRSECDWQLFRALRALGISRWKASVIWSAVALHSKWRTITRTKDRPIQTGVSNVSA